MKKITLYQLEQAFINFNKDNKGKVTQLGRCHIKGAIVFKSSNWPDDDYSLESRTYIVQSDNKFLCLVWVGIHYSLTAWMGQTQVYVSIGILIHGR